MSRYRSRGAFAGAPPMSARHAGETARTASAAQTVAAEVGDVPVDSDGESRYTFANEASGAPHRNHQRAANPPPLADPGAMPVVASTDDGRRRAVPGKPLQRGAWGRWSGARTGDGFREARP